MPVDGDAQHAAQPLRRFLDREELHGLDLIGVGILGPHLMSVSRQQVVELHVPHGAAHDDDALGLAAGKDVLAELRAGHQAHARLLHGLEATQLPLQGVGHFLARRFLAGRRLGQQQARFQVGEPCRHHEIVGGEFEPYPAGLGDMRQVLIDQRHHGDAAQVDLLVARQGEQQVERTLEALQIDDQLALARRDHVRASGGEVVGARALGFIHAVPV